MRKEFNVPQDWSDVTLRQFAKYMGAARLYEEWLDIDETLEEHEKSDNHMVNGYNLSVNMIAPILDVDADELRILSIEQLNDLMGHLLILHKDIEDYGDPFFVWADIGAEEFSEKMSELTSGLGWIFNRAKIKKLREKERVMFFVCEPIQNITLENWISTVEARKKIMALGESVQGGDYEAIAELLSYVCRPKGDVFDFDVAKRRQKLFLELPIHIVMGVANFFFQLQTHSLNNSKICTDWNTTTKNQFRLNPSTWKSGVSS